MSAEADQFFARLGTPPTTARQAIYARCVDGLVLSGVWAKLDALYLFAASDAATAKTNLIQSAFPITPTGAPVFAADSGYTGTGVASDYLSTGFDPTAGTPHYVQNSASLFVWRATAPSGDHGALIGTLPGYKSWVWTSDVSNEMGWEINTGGFTVANLHTETGLHGASRTAVNAVSGSLRGIPLEPKTTASAAPSGVVRICGDGSDSCTSRVAMAAIGSGLTAQDTRNLNNFIQNYLYEIAATIPVVAPSLSLDLVNNGAENYAPAIGRLVDGRLLCVYSAAAANSAVVDGKTVFRTSTDTGNRGLTWSAASDIVTPASGGNTDYNRLTVLPSGIILMSTLIQDPPSFTSDARLYRGTVGGGGTITWELLANLASSLVANAFPCGPPLLLSNGELMMGFAGNGKASVIFSSNLGATWGGEVLVANGNYGFMTFVEKENSEIVAILRKNDAGTPANSGEWRTYGTAHGRTWSSPAQITNDDDPNEGSLAIAPDGTLVEMHRHQFDGGPGYAVYHSSSDGGETWSSIERLYSHGTQGYGVITESQGFYDSITESILFAVGMGSYATTSQIMLETFWPEFAAPEDPAVDDTPSIATTPDDPGRKGPKKKRQKRPLDIQGTTEGLWAGRPAYRIPVDRGLPEKQATLPAPQPKEAPAPISEKTLLQMSQKLVRPDEDEQDMETLRRMGAFD